MLFHPTETIFVLMVLAVVTGCAELPGKAEMSWHSKCGWKAEDFFDDPKVVALCRAIEKNDLTEIDRFIAAGADVNAQGKGKMTPLLWAYPDNKLERFKHLLKCGANPNIVIESDFNSHGGMRPGDSVTHMACKTAFPGYFEAVFEHGGDPNLVKNGLISNETPLFTLIMGSAADKKSKVRLLIDKGANLNHSNGTGTTPVVLATGWGGQYDIALELLEVGADFKVYKPDSNSRLIHTVVGEERRRGSGWTDKQSADFMQLVEWLEKHGESMSEAKADVARWASWVGTPAEKARLRRAEIAKRQAREAREKAAAKQPKNNEK